MAAMPLSGFARTTRGFILLCIALGAAPWMAAKAADCPTKDAREHKVGPYNFRYESRAENGSENDKYVFVRCVENKKDATLYIDWKKTKLSGYVNGGDVSKSEVEFSPRQKIDESSELWYGARPDRLNVNLVRHKEEQSSLLLRLLGLGPAHAQPSIRFLKALPLIQDIDKKWPQREAMGTLRSYTIIGVPISSEDVARDKTVVPQRLMRLSFAMVSRVVRSKDGYRYEYVFAHQYLPSRASSLLSQSAQVHRIRPASAVLAAAFKEAGLSGVLPNFTSFSGQLAKLPSIDDKRSPRAKLEGLDVVDAKGVVLATLPAAVWEPGSGR